MHRLVRPFALLIVAPAVERLARRMAGGDRPLERFRVLNGLGAQDKVKLGDMVKVVVE